jgi:hypothetical protein
MLRAADDMPEQEPARDRRCGQHLGAIRAFARAERKGRSAPRRISGLATCCMRRFNSEASGPRRRGKWPDHEGDGRPLSG